MEGVASCPKDLSKLHYDTACLQVVNSLEFPVDVFALSSDCFQCDPSFLSTAPLLANLSLVVPAVHSLTVSAYRQREEEVLCKQTLSFTQHGLYSWNINDCHVTVVDRGENAYLPFLTFSGIVLWMILLVNVFRCICRSQQLRDMLNRTSVNTDLQNDLGDPSSTPESILIQSELVPLKRLGAPRIQALDTFRGISIALMIFVNYGGGKYWIFDHAPWNGLTVADLVFPWFAWVLGVSLVLSYRSKLRSCVTRLSVLYVSFYRMMTLVTLGLVINMYNKNNLATVRFCGVLQRLGIAHFIVSVLEILFMKKQPSFQRGRWLQVSEVLDCWRQWFVVVLLVALQVAVSFRLPVPGCPLGYLGAGGWANHSSAVNCTGGAARYIDSLVFGDKHLYPGHMKRVYLTTLPFDPEGGKLQFCVLYGVYNLVSK